MILHDQSVLPRTARRALFDFVDEHYHKTYPDDTGALLGQLSKMVEEDFPPLNVDYLVWHEAVSLAVSAH